MLASVDIRARMLRTRWNAGESWDYPTHPASVGRGSPVGADYSRAFGLPGGLLQEIQNVTYRANLTQAGSFEVQLATDLLLDSQGHLREI
jgi:hypothetical protein